MFFFFKKQTKIVKIRDEWGQVHDVEVDMTHYPRLSDHELAELLKCNIGTVKTHRRD